LGCHYIHIPRPRRNYSIITGRTLESISDAVCLQRCLGNGTLEFNEFSNMMRSRTDGGVTRLDLTKRTPTPPDTWKAFKV